MKEYSSHLNMKTWAEEDLPREKLLGKGKTSLSNAELIAILLGSGSREETAVELARRILKSVNGSLVQLSKLSIKELCDFKGVGVVKAISIISALELGKRRRASSVIEKSKITCSYDAYEIFQSYISDINHEEFYILTLNRANHVLRSIKISEGGTAGTVADPKKIFKSALEANASSLILSHNHPSGNIHPSENDIRITKKLIRAGEYLDIAILDHIIVGDNQFYSFADENII